MQPAAADVTAWRVTWDATTRTGLLLAVNRDLGTAHDVTVSLAGLPGVGAGAGSVDAAGDTAGAVGSVGATGSAGTAGSTADGSASGVQVTTARMLHSDDPYLTNTAEHPDAVVPVDLDPVGSPAAGLNADADGTLHLTMPAVSWVAVEFTA